jgi:hypothetical protein
MDSECASTEPVKKKKIEKLEEEVKKLKEIRQQLVPKVR